MSICNTAERFALELFASLSLYYSLSVVCLEPRETMRRSRSRSTFARVFPHDFVTEAINRRTARCNEDINGNLVLIARQTHKRTTHRPVGGWMVWVDGSGRKTTSGYCFRKRSDGTTTRRRAYNAARRAREGGKDDGKYCTCGNDVNLRTVCRSYYGAIIHPRPLFYILISKLVLITSPTTAGRAR